MAAEVADIDAPAGRCPYTYRQSAEVTRALLRCAPGFRYLPPPTLPFAPQRTLEAEWILMKEDYFRISLIDGPINVVMGSLGAPERTFVMDMGRLGQWSLVPKVERHFRVLEAQSRLVTDDTRLMRHGRLGRQKGQRQQSRSQQFVLF
jgi:hypothetical protein